MKKINTLLFIFMLLLVLPQIGVMATGSVVISGLSVTGHADIYLPGYWWGEDAYGKTLTGSNNLDPAGFGICVGTGGTNVHGNGGQANVIVLLNGGVVYGQNNTFEVDLSDASGNFGATPTIVGTKPALTVAQGLYSALGSFVQITIPLNTTPGSYNLRVVTTDPAFTSTPFPITVGTYAPITIGTLTATNGTATQQCPGNGNQTPVTVTVSGSANYLYQAFENSPGVADPYNVMRTPVGPVHSVSASPITYTTSGQALTNVTLGVRSDAVCSAPLLTNSLVFTGAVPNPQANITSTLPGTIVCVSTNATFTANVTNMTGACSISSYAWSVGNAVQTGQNAPTFAYTPANGDNVTATVTYSITGCSGSYSVTSSSFTVDNIDDPTNPPTISLTSSMPGSLDNPNYICPGTYEVFAATVGNPGPNPKYIWYKRPHNGTFTAISGQISSTYIDDALLNGDEVYVSVTKNGACSSSNQDASSSSIIANVQVCPSSNGTYWLGQDQGWSNGYNWTNGVPSSSTNAFIQSTVNNPIIASGNYATKNLTFWGYASAQGLNTTTLTISGTLTGGYLGPLNELDVSGDIKGAINGITTLKLNGSSQLITAGGNFTNLMISGGTKTLQADFAVDGVLTLTSGTLAVSNLGALALTSSDPTHSALVDFRPGCTGQVTGNVTCDWTAVPATDLTFYQHYMGIPVSGPSFLSIGANTTHGAAGDHETNVDCAENHLGAGSANGTVLYYDESYNYPNCMLEDWQVVNPGASVATGIGYSNKANSLSVTGSLNSGTYNIACSNTAKPAVNDNNGHSLQSGWHILCNPYMSTLNLSTSGQNSQFGFVYVFNSQSGSFETRTLGSADLAPFEAFLVQAPSGGATFSMHKTECVPTPSVGGYEQLLANQLNITAINNNTGLKDYTLVGFQADATIGWDTMYDAAKLPGLLTRHNLYTMLGDRWASRNILPSGNSNVTTVNLGLEPGVSGSYTLHFDGVNGFDPTAYIYLEDTRLHTMTDIRSGDYNFTANASDDWNRFVLHFTPPATTSTTDASCTIPGTISVQQPGSALWNYSLTNSNNAVISSGLLNVNTPLNVNAPAGLYTLTLTDSNGYSAVKSIVVNGGQLASAIFTATADTVVPLQTITFTGTATGGAVYNWNFGDGSTGSGLTVNHNYQNEGNYTVVLNVTDSSGCISVNNQLVTVTQRAATGLNTLSGKGEIKLWSTENVIHIDFSQAQNMETTVEIYDVLGQKIAGDKFTSGSMYTKQIDNIATGYVLVQVNNGVDIITRKLFIVNK